MRFRRGVFLMVATGAVLVAVVVGIAMALTGGKGKTPAEAPVAESSPTRSASAGPTGRTPAPHTTRRPQTSSSTMVGVPDAPPPETTRPQNTTPTTPAGPPNWWTKGPDPRYRRWHGSPPPWWHHR